MALIACTECNKQISDKADSCPGCGAPVQSRHPSPGIGSCPSCGDVVDMKASSCPRCKAIFADDGWKPLPGGFASEPVVNRWPEEPKKEKSSVWKWLVGVPVGGFLLMMIVGSCTNNTPDGRERQASRDAISYCWDQQSKKSLDPGAARFAASACEKMESEFRDRWGRSP